MLHYTNLIPNNDIFFIICVNEEIRFFCLLIINYMTTWMADVMVNWINISFVKYLLIVHASDQNFFFDLGFKASD
jgi:hypothetical protein